MMGRNRKWAALATAAALATLTAGCGEETSTDSAVQAMGSVDQQFAADGFGKLKMVFQCVAIGTVLGQYAFPWPEPFLKFLNLMVHLLVWGTLLTTVGSGTSYILKTRRMLSESTPAA